MKSGKAAVLESKDPTQCTIGIHAGLLKPLFADRLAAKTQKLHFLPFLDTYKKAEAANNNPLRVATRAALRMNLAILDMSGVSLEDYEYVSNHQFDPSVILKVWTKLVAPTSVNITEMKGNIEISQEESEGAELLLALRSGS